MGLVELKSSQLEGHFRQISLQAALYEPREKTGLWGFDQVPHKPGCTATEDGWRLEISDLESRGIVLSMWRKQRH